MNVFTSCLGSICLLALNVVTTGWTGAPPQACPPPITWQQTYGGEANDYLFRLRPLPDNGWMAVGSSASVTGDRGNELYGGTDAWVVRFDAERSIVWQHSFGGNALDQAASIFPLIGGGFILGATSRSDVSGNKTTPGFGHADYWLIRLDASGSKLWEKSFGGSDDDYLSLAVPTSDGGFILGGASSSPAGGNKTSVWHGVSFRSSDLWIVKTDATGAKLWEQSYGGSRGDYFASLVELGDGGFLLAGSSDSPADGVKTTDSFGGADYWVIRINASGEILWQKSYGGTSWEYLNDMVATADGGFLLAGLSHSGQDGNKTSPPYGDADYWVIKLDSLGDKVWENSYGGTAADTPLAIEPAPNGGFLVGGSSASLPGTNKTSSLHGYSDYWLLQIGNSGEKLWEQSFGGLNEDIANALARRTNGALLVGGWSVSPVRDNKTAPLLGEADFWLIELAPETPGDCDGDGIPDALDHCPGTSPGTFVNSNGCTLAQLCPCDSAWAAHSNYVACVQETTAGFVRDEIITEAQRYQLIVAAESADCPRTPVTAVYFGLTNAILGDAHFASEPTDSQLAISDVGPDGNDGVSVRLGRSDAAVFIYPYADIWGNYDPAWFMLGTAIGRVNGTNDQLIASVRGRKPDYEVYPIDLDLTPLGPASLTYQAFANGAVVSEATVAGAQGTVTIRSANDLTPRVSPFWRMPDGSVGVLIEFTERIDGALPEFQINGPFDIGAADALFIRADHPANQVRFVSHVDVRVGGGLREFRFLDERPVAFGRIHRALGPVVLEPDLGRFGVLRPDGGSGSDEPSGVLIESRREDQLDLGLEPLSLTESNPIVTLHVNGRVSDGGDSIAAVRLALHNNAITAFSTFAGSEEAVTVQAYRDGVLQGSVAGTNMSALGSFLISNPEDPPRLVGSGGSSSIQEGSPVSVRFSFDRITTFRSTGGTELQGDHYRLGRASNSIPAVLESFALMVTGPPGFAIVSETGNAEVPKIQIRSGDNGLELSWVSGNVPVLLEASDQLPGSFSLVQAERVFEDGAWTVRLPGVDPATRFFRLRRAID